MKRKQDLKKQIVLDSVGHSFAFLDNEKYSP